MARNGKRNQKGAKSKTITEGNVPDLRIKNPNHEHYIYVANLASQGRRSIPKQLEIIIEEHKKLTAQQ